MDSIGNFLTSIRNAGMVGYETVDVVSSKLKESIAASLKDAGYIRSFKVAKGHGMSFMRVYLKYDEKRVHCIKKISRVSKPSCSVYRSAKSLGEVRSGFGIYILSTNKGVMTNRQAMKQNVGGEVLCEVW